MIGTVLLEGDLALLVVLVRQVEHDCASLEDPEIAVLDCGNALANTPN